jgi:hypothetical protein
MHTIKLSRSTGQWVATFSDPEVTRLFGTPSVIMGFTPTADPEYVLSSTRDSNPDCAVSLEGE